MRRAIVAMAMAVLLMTAGCVVTEHQGPRPPTPDKGNSPEKTFTMVRDAMMAGDVDKAFTGYSEHKKRIEGGLEAFRQKYAESKDTWLTLFTGSRVTFVSIDNQQATAVVLWGNGERYPPVPFIIENGLWKIDQ